MVTAAPAVPLPLTVTATLLKAVPLVGETMMGAGSATTLTETGVAAGLVSLPSCSVAVRVELPKAKTTEAEKDPDSPMTKLVSGVPVATAPAYT